MESIQQNDVSNIELLHDYLENKKSQLAELFHYTNLEVLLRVLRSGKLLLNNVKNLNDSLEQKRIIQQKPGGCYVASFTNTPRENVHYWAVYGRGDHFSVRLRFDADSFSDLSRLEFVDEEGNTVPVEEAKLSDVIYCSPSLKKLTAEQKRNNERKWKHNGNYFNLTVCERTMSEHFAGLWKHDIWEHERETRLFVRSPFNKERIFLRLTDRMVESMAVRFSPWLPEEIRPDITLMLQAVIRDEYGTDKPKKFCMKSTIYNQIKI